MIDRGAVRLAVVWFARSIAGWSGVAAQVRVALSTESARAGVAKPGGTSPTPAGDRILCGTRFPVWESIGGCRMSRTGRRRNDSKSSLELKKLRAETGIAERQLKEMRLRMTYETIKVGVAIVIAFNATIVMFKTTGLFF